MLCGIESLFKRYCVQTSANYTSCHGVSNVARYGAADVAQTPYVEVTCFHDVIDIILKCESVV